MARTRGNILLVDDDPGLLRLLSLRLQAHGYKIETAEDGEAALAVVTTLRPDLVISDLRMRPMNGLDLLHRLQSLMPGLPVLLITAYGTISNAIEATRKGAYGFLTKPIDPDALLQQVDEAIAVARPTGYNENQEKRIVTRSPEMLELLAEARMVADTDSSVLVRGESGTGKELLARFIHDASARRERGFVAVNCSAIPENLLESELFGHVRGAFTGADRDRQGLFVSAEGGSLFLDEIGDMPPSLQVKLLRVLEERKIRPVGSNREVAIDVRVISATHRDLSAEIARGAFREDLYYRLNVVTLRLAPLRERREDIPLLANHFLAQMGWRDSAKPKIYSPQAMMRLVSGQWPGNVRQLQNVVERNVVLAPAPVISLRQVQKAMGDMQKTMLPFTEARADFARLYLSQLLHICEGNVSQAARLAQRNRTDFYKLLSRHRLDPAQFKGEQGAVG